MTHSLPVHLLKVGVSLLQHGGEASGLRFPAFSGAGFFEAPMQADLLQSLFAVQFLLKPAEGLFYWFTFLKPDFSHNKILPTKPQDHRTPRPPGEAIQPPAWCRGTREAEFVPARIVKPPDALLSSASTNVTALVPVLWR